MTRVGSQCHRKKEEIVRQVGHLPELYEDAPTEKYKILSTSYLNSNLVHNANTRNSEQQFYATHVVVTFSNHLLFHTTGSTNHYPA